MIFEEAFENTIYPNLKEYVEEKSIYNPHITRTMPLESNMFPIVSIKLLPTTNEYSNLSYSEEIYTFGIDINIYAQDTTLNDVTISKRTICNEITEHIIDFFKINYRVTIKTELDVINSDSTVHRNEIIISGKLDTKYQDRLVIYPK